MNTLVELTNVRKQYRNGVVALDQVTLDLRQGARVCLLGPNGAGKTTLLRILTGALEPSAGHVSLFGKTPGTKAFDDARKNIGFVPQSPGMYRDLRVREYMEIVRDLYGRGDVDATLAGLGLDAYAEREMAVLSGGWQRKLVLAAALVSDPALLLFDEPTVGLDPVATREVHARLQQAMRGRTTLLCTHNLAEAEALCDTVAVLVQGRVIAYEQISVLRARLPARIGVRVIGDTVRLAQALEAAGHAVTTDDATVWFVTENAEVHAAELMRTLIENGHSVCECRIVPPSLEELFVRLLGSHYEQ